MPKGSRHSNGHSGDYSRQSSGGSSRMDEEADDPFDTPYDPNGDYKNNYAKQHHSEKHKSDHDEKSHRRDRHDDRHSRRTSRDHENGHERKRRSSKSEKSKHDEPPQSFETAFDEAITGTPSKMVNSRKLNLPKGMQIKDKERKRQSVSGPPGTPTGPPPEKATKLDKQDSHESSRHSGAAQFHAINRTESGKTAKMLELMPNPKEYKKAKKAGWTTLDTNIFEETSPSRENSPPLPPINAQGQVVAKRSEPPSETVSPHMKEVHHQNFTRQHSNSRAEIRHNTRKNVRDILFSRLQKYKDGGGDDHQLLKKNDTHVQKLVAKLEDDISRQYDAVEDKNYIAQVRRILMNFRQKENDLWERFLRGDISTRELAKMNSEDMLPLKEQERRRKSADRELEKIMQQEKDKIEQIAKGERTKVTHKGILEIEVDPNETSKFADDNNIFETSLHNHSSLEKATKAKKVKKDKKEKKKSKKKDKKEKKSKKDKKEKKKSKKKKEDEEIVVEQRVHQDITFSSSSSSDSEDAEVREKCKPRVQKDDNSGKTVEELVEMQEVPDVEDAENLNSAPTSYAYKPEVKKDKDLNDSINHQQELTNLRTIFQKDTFTTKKLNVEPLMKKKKEGKQKLWSGGMCFQEGKKVTRFKSNMYYVNGDADAIMNELSFKDFSVGGKINPSDVWNYVKAVKRSKQCVVVIFYAAARSEAQNYLHIMNTLYNKGRFGVVTNNKRIKDFYIIPVKEDDPYPEQLLESGFEGGPGIDIYTKGKQAMLLGVIVRHVAKAMTGSAPNSPLSLPGTPSYPPPPHLRRNAKNKPPSRQPTPTLPKAKSPANPKSPASGYVKTPESIPPPVNEIPDETLPEPIELDNKDVNAEMNMLNFLNSNSPLGAQRDPTPILGNSPIQREPSPLPEETYTKSPEPVILDLDKPPTGAPVKPATMKTKDNAQDALKKLSKTVPALPDPKQKSVIPPLPEPRVEKMKVAPKAVEEKTSAAAAPAPIDSDLMNILQNQTLLQTITNALKQNRQQEERHKRKVDSDIMEIDDQDEEMPPTPPSADTSGMLPPLHLHALDFIPDANSQTILPPELLTQNSTHATPVAVQPRGWDVLEGDENANKSIPDTLAFMDDDEQQLINAHRKNPKPVAPPVAVAPIQAAAPQAAAPMPMVPPTGGTVAPAAPVPAAPMQTAPRDPSGMYQQTYAGHITPSLPPHPTFNSRGGLGPRGHFPQQRDPNYMPQYNNRGGPMMQPRGGHYSMRGPAPYNGGPGRAYTTYDDAAPPPPSAYVEAKMPLLEAPEHAAVTPPLDPAYTTLNLKQGPPRTAPGQSPFPQGGARGRGTWSQQARNDRPNNFGRGSRGGRGRGRGFGHDPTGITPDPEARQYQSMNVQDDFYKDHEYHPFPDEKESAGVFGEKGDPFKNNVAAD